ncbi:MAG: replicative DNA helicase [Magnetospiraceae bacterium]
MSDVALSQPFVSENAEPAAVPGFRAPPHNYEAEKALLGAILANNKAFEAVSEFLRPDHFADSINGRAYEACSLLIERGQLASPVTLKNYFEQNQALSEVGGTKYLAELAASAVTIINAGEYGRIVYDLFLRRELIGLGERMVNKAYGGDIDETALSQIEESEQRLYDLATTGEIEGGFTDLREALLQALTSAEAAHKRDGALAGVTTGLKDLDGMLGGLHPTDLLILAARPSMGKTALATNLAYNAAARYHETNGDEGAVVGFFSLEMSAEQLAGRIISERTSIPSDAMRKGNLSNEEFEVLVRESQTLYEIPLFIDDTPALTVSALRTRARRLKRQHNLGMIIVDYLQLLSANKGSRADSRVQEVSEMTRGLKTLAKELNVPVIALSQLSRAVEQREDKRPQLADLRESGSIEQDADVVMFIYRAQYYLERGEPQQRADEADDKFHERHERWQQRVEEVYNLAEVLIAKQRHGPIGTTKVYFDGRYSRFADWISDDQVPAH